MLLPGVGTFVGGVIGGVLGSITAGGVGKQVSGKLFDHKIKKDCPLCWFNHSWWRVPHTVSLTSLNQPNSTWIGDRSTSLLQKMHFIY